MTHRSAQRQRLFGRDFLSAAIVALLLPTVAHGNAADRVRAIEDPETRIAEEMWAGFNSVNPDQRTQFRNNALDALLASATNNPNDIHRVHFRFRRAQSQKEIADHVIPNAIQVLEVVFKQYEAESNLVWTSGTTEYEMYAAAPAEILRYIVERMNFQAQAIRYLQVTENELSPPPIITEPSIYEVSGYFEGKDIQAVIKNRRSTLLHASGHSLSWWSRWGLYFQLMLSRKQPLPDSLPVIPYPAEKLRSDYFSQ